MGLYLNPNNESFARLIRSNSYVDKTGLIAYMNDIAALEEYKGNILLVGINYDKKSKEHQCRIERA